jgi:hypothetical protein
MYGTVYIYINWLIVFFGVILYVKQYVFFFSRKEAKALVLLRRRLYGLPNPRRSRPWGSGGVPPVVFFDLFF